MTKARAWASRAARVELGAAGGDLELGAGLDRRGLGALLGPADRLFAAELDLGLGAGDHHLAVGQLEGGPPGQRLDLRRVDLLVDPLLELLVAEPELLGLAGDVGGDRGPLGRGQKLLDLGVEDPHVEQLDVVDPHAVLLEVPALALALLGAGPEDRVADDVGAVGVEPLDRRRPGRRRG